MTAPAPRPPIEVDLLLDLDPSGGLSPAPGHGGGRRVLVVDATAIARKFLVLRLVQLGYRAEGIERGDAALARLRAASFAIVFSELVLGAGDALDGLALCRAVKQPHGGDPTQPPPACVLVSGRFDASDRVRGTLAGCDAYLTKPLDEGALRAVLQAVDPRFR